MSLSKAESEALELVLQSILYNNDDLLRELVQENPPLINFADSNGWTILHHAAVKGHTQCVLVLLESGADIDALSEPAKGGLKSALMLASEQGKTETAELLVNYGADLFACDANGYSALQLAQLRAHDATAQLLINSSENIHSQAIQLRAKLCAACIDNDFGVVQEVMNEAPRSAHKQILNGESGEEKSALYLACEHGRVEILSTLLKFSSKHSILYTPTGDTILHASVASQDPATVEIVIEKFPYLMDVANNEGSLVLHWACRCGNLEVVKILLEHTYPKSELKPVENGHGGESFYQFACDLNAADNECRTPLYLAVANGHTSVLHYLTTFKLPILQSKSSGVQSSSNLEGCPFMLDVYCNNGRTPLIIACANGNLDMVKILLEHGADINLPVALTDVEISNLKPMEEARCAGSGALIEAAKGGHLELLGHLLRHGALDYDNKALAVVVENEKWDLVSSFLCQLTFPDPEYRINKHAKSKELPLTNLLLNTTNLLPQVYPNTACQLNWHNVSLDRLAVDWLVNAALHLNTRVRQSKLALSAITRLDLSNNRLTLLPHTLFQLSSLRILNVDENCITRIEVPPNGDWQAMCLETCSLANNYIVELPVGLFSEKLMPQLKILNVSGNRLHHLPPEIWTAPRLRELNCMNNEIVNISSIIIEHDHRQHRQQNGGYRRQARPSRRQESSQQKQLAQGEPEEIKEIIASTGVTPRPEGQPWAANVTDVDVIRVNIWQKKIQLSNIEDYENDDNASSALNSNQPRAASLSKDGKLDSAVAVAATSDFSSALRILNLSGNKLKIVPNCLACCAPRLTRLDLSMNEISSIGPVECLPGSLRHLNMANNQLSRCFTRHAMDHSMMRSCQAPVPLNPTTITQHGKPGPAVISDSYSVNRHSRSRSKSVARNQRSLSVIRAAEDRSSGALIGELEPCVHRSHCRLEALKSLNLSHNRLQTVDMMVAFGGGGNAGSLEHFNWKENGQQMKSYMLFPALTTFDLSHNQLKCIPPTISLLSYLAVLNLASNHELDTLPPELGLLDKLWNVVLKDCPLKKEQEPLRSMVNDHYKTTEVLLHLRNKLENSKLYPKMKLMLVGGPEVGKSTLLQSFMRQEGQVSKKALQSESWARRMGHTPAKGFSPSSSAKGYSSPTASANNHLLSAIRKGFPVDVVEWSYEPKKSSKTTPSSQETTVGSVTFRTWDFTGLQKEFAVIQQYFFTRRCLYLVVWKVTEGEIALNEIHDWLLNIQARAPNSTVLIIGTHADYVKDNPDVNQRFPREYLEELHNNIQDRFVNVSDAEKKGLPKVIASIYVSTKSKDDIKSLCNILYQVAAEIRSIGSGSSRRNKMMSQKVPASFVALEKIVVSVTDELRTKGEEPILRFDDFWVLATTQMIEEYGKPFRDILEFRQACNFLHENGGLAMSFQLDRFN
uniref:Non-specific serine/threonine protein kinase n=1 Tax=Ditylenchus dipsaci TaxID=166011 RepID=A0A915CSY4_9BILA